VSDTPRTSAWWKSWYPKDGPRDEDWELCVSDLAASERSDAIHLEALAESEASCKKMTDAAIVAINRADNAEAVSRLLRERGKK